MPRTVRKLGIKLRDDVALGELRSVAEALAAGEQVNVGPVTGRDLDRLIAQVSAGFEGDLIVGESDGHGKEDTYLQLN
jgi:hypothetical protein